MRRTSALWKPGDLTITSDAGQKELFLVEGRSAQSTLRQAMNRQTQDVFAVQGKVLNVQNLSDEKILANDVCAALFSTLGCGTGAQCDPQKLRHSRVVLLTDPDVDGAHARALLAYLFMKLLRPLVESGRVLAVIPPLWRVDLSSERPVYAWTDAELREHRAGEQSDAPITRFRGVAQFSQRECVELLLNPETRRQVRLSLN